MPRRRLQSQLDGELVRHNIAYTEPRNRVFMALKQTQPCTLEELIQKLEGKVSRRTVVRATLLFEELGLTFRPEGKLIHLAPRLYQHAHELVCTICDRRIPYRDQQLEQVLERIARSRNFAPLGHLVTIPGRCGKHVDHP